MVWDSVNNRMVSKAGPEHFKTYSQTAPLSTHWKRGTCEEVGCDDLRNGFVTTVNTDSELGRKQFYYLTHDKDRSYSMQRVGPTLFKFVYKPGNPCMRRASHRVPIGRPSFYLVAEGDWRGNPRRTPPMRHRRAEDWVEDFALHQRTIADAIQRG
jgi:hypothetical protein